MKLLPSISTRGVYTLKEPFQTDLITKVMYTCVAVRKMEDVVAAGADPFALYYAPKSISLADYTTDLNDGVCIISLQAPNGSLVYVPNSYIERMPDQGGIPYTTMALAVSLGALPDTTNLEYLKQRLQSAVLETVGVASDVREVAISLPVMMTQEEHTAIEAARADAVSNADTDYANLLAMTTQRDALLQKVQQLEAYILSLNQPPTP